MEVHLNGVQLKASMKDPPPPRDMEPPRDPEVHENDREASSPAIPPGENPPRTTTAPPGNANEFPPPKPPQVSNSGRQDPSPSTRRHDKHPRVHSVSSSSKSRFYEEEIRELHRKNQRLETTMENVQKVLNGLLQGKSNVTLPKKKEKGQETTVPVNDGRTRHSTSNTPREKPREHPGPSRPP